MATCACGEINEYQEDGWICRGCREAAGVARIAEVCEASREARLTPPELQKVSALMKVVGKAMTLKPDDFVFRETDLFPAQRAFIADLSGNGNDIVAACSPWSPDLDAIAAVDREIVAAVMATHDFSSLGVRRAELVELRNRREELTTDPALINEARLAVEGARNMRKVAQALLEKLPRKLRSELFEELHS